MEEKREKPQLPEKCKVWKKCGGCQYQGVSYTEQIKIKQKNMNKLLKKYGNVKAIIGMENPFYYRNKVHAVFDRDKKGNVICGTYEAGTHRVVPVEECMIEDKISQEIIRAIRDMLKSFRIKTYDEDTGYGLLRHVLVRRGFSTDEIMVVLVVASPIFPSKNNFVKALRKKFPQISTVVLNVNDKKTSMVLGERDIVLYGKGFIRDRLCGCTFRISPQSFYQVNPVQTELLYKTAIEYAGLGRKEQVIDAYCGIGTIGLVAAGKAREVIGIELNKNAVRDAIVNARENKITNARFYQGDAGEFMEGMVSEGERADVVFMDPPRTGSTEKFLTSMVKLGPSRIVYISCGPDTLARDLEFLTKHGYVTRKIQPVDMFSFTEHCEVVCLLTKQFTERTSYSNPLK
ncbi:23S rRNA (uracil(1939)-C(5))-methyltransferase RlmD [Blautia difficilis]|uniref:23S rRNA (Uracil(1939)-C(5))-methyltransferase RlmD n=1 Tax=Blautia difficilis TaxID=2763027 RepID=A0ABR7IGL2_9FIRM|nr:23S rRNA (uracil(1939)-C(5))-methyltransferase RlmD [Blautia difficilis]MBC5779162.1 23S rRNA (uracil(1939)-C(5))-methyltransferase RlmD [Blautia difficilis]